MNPSNRRVAPPQLPPDVMAQDYEAPFEEGPSDSAAPPPTRAPQRSARLVRAMVILRAVLGAVVVVGVAVGVAWGARRYVRESPRFALKDVRVNGLHHRGQGDIVERAGLVLGTNLFGIDLEDARQKLIADPWLANVSLSRRLPGSIAIEVVEREAAALVAVGDTTYLATRDGEIFKRLELGDPVDLPIVSGLTADGVAEDREGAVTEVKRALDLGAEYSESNLAGKAPLQQIHVAEDGALTLVVGKSGLTISLGKAPYRRKLEQAARVASELERRLGPRALSDKTDGIMLDSEARADRVVVRMR